MFQRLGNLNCVFNQNYITPQDLLWQTQPPELPSCNHCEAFVLCILLLIFTYEINEAVAGPGWVNMQKSGSMHINTMVNLRIF